VRDIAHNPKSCPWCGKEVTQPPLDPQTGLLLLFVCEDCGSLLFFCSQACWREAHIALLKAEGYTGKQARRKLKDPGWIIELPPPTA